MMSIVIFGAGGRTGSYAAAEATARGHRVTLMRRADADLTHPEAVARVASGHDAVIAAVAPADADPRSFFQAAANGLVTGLWSAGVARLVWVSIASLLPGPSGVPAADTDGFPEEYRPFSLGHRMALETVKASDLRWTAVSPAGDFAPGAPPTGGYVLTEYGDLSSRITHADHARALVDMAEQSEARAGHFGVAPPAPDEAAPVAAEGSRR